MKNNDIDIPVVIVTGVISISVICSIIYVDLVMFKFTFSTFLKIFGG